MLNADCGRMTGASFSSLLYPFQGFPRHVAWGSIPGGWFRPTLPKGGTPMRPLSQELEAGGTRKVGRRYRGRLGALLLIAATGAWFQPAAAQQAQSARITGKVTDALSGAPLTDVQVFLAGANLGAITRQTGTYLILNVPAGTYEL